jgi:hypothetical protein
MSTALRLVRDTGGDDGGLPPLDGWELFMRGAGRSERTVRPFKWVLWRRSDARC